MKAAGRGAFNTPVSLTEAIEGLTMAKAKALPSADAWPAEGLPIDAACKRIAPALWDDYAKKRDDARDVHRMRELGFAPLTLGADEKRRSAACEQAQAALDTQLREGLEHREYVLQLHPDTPSLDPKPVPATAAWELQFNYEQRTVEWRGRKFYDARLHGGRSPATGEPEPSSRRRTPGAKPQFDWDAIQAWCFRRFGDLGFPDNVSEFCRGEVLPWCTKQFGEVRMPDMETLRPRVNGWIDAWQRSLPRV
jgi:hypothetical protein